MPSINGDKVVIWNGRLGFGPECCGCCCVDGEQDPDKKSRGDCHDAGGTWYPGIPCDEYPICSDCFECDPLPEGTTVTSRVKAWMPPYDVRGPDWFAPGPFVPEITNCTEQGPIEAEFELTFSDVSNSYYGFALVDAGNGTFLILETELFCAPGICEGHSLWQSVSNCRVPYCGGFLPDPPAADPACGFSFCMVPFGWEGFCAIGSGFVFHKQFRDGDLCLPESASKYAEGGVQVTGAGFFDPVGCEYAIDVDVTIDYP